MSSKVTKASHVLLIIVIAQFLCTSLWFAGNAIVDDLITQHGFASNAVSHLTSAIQLGFIVGTLGYALLNIADRYSPSIVFLVSAFLAAVWNIMLTLEVLSFELALTSRFFTGIFLAGIYPVGMKIAADYFDKTLGKSLGLLVGALVVGTALPHLIKSNLGNLPYRFVIYAVTTCAITGGLMIGIFIADGPFRRPSQKVNLGLTFAAFKKAEFKSAAFGYFGHMWELYSYYAFLPAILVYWSAIHDVTINISFWSFVLIALGGLGCAISGFLSNIFQPQKLATFALTVSGLICLLTPLLFGISMPMVFLGLMFIWGTTVAADSPMFSTLVAQNAIPELKGTALTIVNCIGFALTIVSIQLLNWLSNYIPFPFLFVVLGIGPIFGLISLWRKRTS
ncbi:MFS transporter [Portibacter marinus]|uniref:MFS transporter n=1 Tax=Portibacter marinus TaxID=2898660 RepID=UPI001F17F2A1|nr:MFS transporter [Portibacter marinus]